MRPTWIGHVLTENENLRVEYLRLYNAPSCILLIWHEELPELEKKRIMGRNLGNFNPNLFMKPMSEDTLFNND